MKIDRMITNICSEDLEKSKDFYTSLLDFTIAFESNWFIQLTGTHPSLELGIISKSHEIVPEEVRDRPSGFYISFVVEDADALFQKALANNYIVIQKPHDTFYGQRRLLLKDPDGSIVDISSLIR